MRRGMRSRKSSAMCFGMSRRWLPKSVFLLMISRKATSRSFMTEWSEVYLRATETTDDENSYEIWCYDRHGSSRGAQNGIQDVLCVSERYGAGTGIERAHLRGVQRSAGHAAGAESRRNRACAARRSCAQLRSGSAVKV